MQEDIKEEKEVVIKKEVKPIVKKVIEYPVEINYDVNLLKTRMKKKFNATLKEENDSSVIFESKTSIIKFNR